MSSYLETFYFTEEYGENKYPQKLCNYIYERYFKDYISKNNIKNPRLLDIGSGKGNHLVGFSKLGVEVYGLDKRDECVQILKDFDIRECDIGKDKFPFKDNFFDFVFSKSVLEHVENTDNLLSESLRLLKPGGIAVNLTPDWKSQLKFFWNDYTHVKAFTRKGLQDAMKINGFSNVECSYFIQLPFIWKYPFSKFMTRIISLLPDSLKWKDKEESQPRKLIRFSKEEMLLAVGTKKITKNKNE